MTASVWSRAAQLADPAELRWRRDPAGWARDRLGAELWSKQVEIMQAVAEHRRTAVRSAHGIGKTWTAAALALWWIDTHPPGDAYVVSTAPSYDQVHTLLWEEIRKGHAKAGMPGKVTLSDEWKLGDGTLVGQGRKPPDHKEGLFQGLHRRYVLVLMDEAAYIPAWLWVAVETITTNADCRILAIGNPDVPRTEFHKASLPGSGWHPIRISLFDSPNFTGEPVSADLAAVLTSKEWEADKRERWKGLPLYTSKILAEFPADDSPWTVVPYEWLTGCRFLEHPEGTPVEAGVDVAAGGDRTVMRERRGTRAGRELVFVDSDPMRSVGALVDKIVEWGVTKVKIDVIGVGWGIYGRLRELSSRHNPTGHTTHHAEVVPVNFAEKPTPGTEKEYRNRRAEVWWMGRENSRLKLWDLTEVDDDTLAELTAPQYENVESSGKKKIEAKEKVIGRLGVSPDRAEALLLAFWSPDSRGELPPRRTLDLLTRDVTRGLVPGEYGGALLR